MERGPALQPQVNLCKSVSWTLGHEKDDTIKVTIVLLGLQKRTGRNSSHVCSSTHDILNKKGLC